MLINDLQISHAASMRNDLQCYCEDDRDMSQGKLNTGLESECRDPTEKHATNSTSKLCTYSFFPIKYSAVVFALFFPRS